MLPVSRPGSVVHRLDPSHCLAVGNRLAEYFVAHPWNSNKHVVEVSQLIGHCFLMPRVLLPLFVRVEVIIVVDLTLLQNAHFVWVVARLGALNFKFRELL